MRGGGGISFYLFFLLVFSRSEAREMHSKRHQQLFKELKIPPISPLNPSKDFSVSEAIRFRRLSGAAYCERGLQNWTCEFCDEQSLVDVTVFESEKRFVKGFIGYDKERRRAVVSFRGTEPKSFENWLENLDATHAGFPVADFEGKGRVHAGFLDAYVQIRLNLTYAVARLSEKYSSFESDDDGVRLSVEEKGEKKDESSSKNEKDLPPFPIEITGHSLGGALATIAAMDLESGNHDPDRKHIIQKKVDVKSVYTFGSPRVGDGVFAEIYAERLGFKTYRLTHGRDVVPSVPNTLLGFRHVPTEVYEDRNGNITIGDGSGEWKGGEDHVWRRYSVSDHLYYLGEYICGCNS
ncbi:unnamed protein product [Bathycoccus prasinos]|jgi:hypothetical protein|uniref:Fungal lipase-type domain-containing protein n=1 Tax=Bathycoccus prasinos TaxID=41875 RepID=K8E9J2_9CHLO|nr:predicted protein [Bathycoccus prasinos]CCO14299.1 predicted protein [Bathycoccus prasinos]|mmetsp:Transcript_5567/g.17622  ORF Transcript_5567/g.17622 Transcript_5567/m.17622 type:complete len:351 (-) Transcript_5567:1231-2283(-)|eukprot:XP_007515420.1 predicted protein [Bathycoccus prasinos]